MALRPVSNPPNPFSSWTREWLELPPPASLQVFEEQARSILSRNESRDIPFRWSVNPYRGCFHGCAYCYARPTHQYLDMGAGTDFERKLIVKTNAPALLEAAFKRRSWQGELILFSGNTDCYQPLELHYESTRRCLEVCRRYRNPLGIITKSSIVERDIELLAELSKLTRCAVTISLPFLDNEQARALEHSVPSPRRRLETIAKLAAAGVWVGVSVSPIIPGLNDSAIPGILKAAREAGARSAFCLLLRLDASVEPVFIERLRSELPSHADKVLHQLEACREGTRGGGRSRMSGSGPRWKIIRDLFENTRRRLGYEDHPPSPRPTTFRRPGSCQQLQLFGESP